MSSHTFDFALESYREKPTTYNKALMFFSCVDFFAYTIVSNYVDDDASMHDPKIIREETGCSKELLLGLVMGKTLMRGNTGERFATLMRILCHRNGGTFVGLNSYR